MTKFLRKYGNAILLTTLVAMLLSIVGYGGYLFTVKDTSDAAAMVGSVKIPYSFYRQLADQNLERYRKEKKAEVTDADAKQIRQETLQGLVTNELCAQQAESLGLSVSDEELAFSIQHDPMFQTEGGGFNPQLYAQMVIQGFGTTIEDYETKRRRELLASKFKFLIFNRVKLIPAELPLEYKLSHKGSDKGFEKDKPEFSQALSRLRAIYTLQSALRKALGKIEVHSYIDEKEGS